MPRKIDGHQSYNLGLMMTKRMWTADGKKVDFVTKRAVMAGSCELWQLTESRLLSFWRLNCDVVL